MGIVDPESRLLEGGNFIIAQWHGTPDARIMRDENGCVGSVKYKDLLKICSSYVCKKGTCVCVYVCMSVCVCVSLCVCVWLCVFV